MDFDLSVLPTSRPDPGMDLNFTNSSNKCRPRGPSGQMQICGYCDVQCIYTAVRLVFIIGVLVNILMVSRVIRDKKLRTPTFIALASLAISDALFLLFNIVIGVEFIFTRTTCNTRDRTFFNYLPGLLAMFWFSASFHVTFLAAMRYIVLAHPLKALVLLTKKRMIIMSVLIWVVAVLTFGTIMLTNRIRDKPMQGASTGQRRAKRDYIKIITWFLTYFMPIVITSLLHFVKILVLKRNSAKQTQIQANVLDGRRRHSSRRMARVIILIIIAGVILPLPTLILEMLKDVSDIDIKDVTLRSHLRGIAKTLFLLSFSINPFIYSFGSKTFRNSLRRMTLSKKSLNARSIEQNTRTTPVGTPVIKSRSNRESNALSAGENAQMTPGARSQMVEKTTAHFTTNDSVKSGDGDDEIDNNLCFKGDSTEIKHPACDEEIELNDDTECETKGIQYSTENTLEMSSTDIRTEIVYCGFNDNMTEDIASKADVE